MRAEGEEEACPRRERKVFCRGLVIGKYPIDIYMPGTSYFSDT